jgi:hypothetical protein
MNSALAWLGFAVIAVLLGAVGFQFSLRTLRWFAFAVVLAIVVYLPLYGLTHPVRKPGSLSDAFARGADTLSGALIRPLSFGHQVPVPGRIGWLVIAVLLALGYRVLEAWAMRRQAPSLVVPSLASDRQDDAASAASAEIGKQQHELLVAELKFRLPAVEVRSPAILPGGSRPSGLASIAEATGVAGAGLAGAIIRFFGMVWPNPPRIQVRTWVERTTDDNVTLVTVGLADPRSGANIATKTLAASNLDAAAAAVAGFVARHIFARDRTVPPWCKSATDGADLAALLRARQVRGYPECRTRLYGAWQQQIEILEGVARANLCAGVVRYELAQLYDLTAKHVDALLLHAVNREQYPRFYRGRYRLAMSLEMLANPHAELGQIDVTVLRDALRILARCGLIGDDVAGKLCDRDQAGLMDPLRPHLLAAAEREFKAIQQYLTWRHIVWETFRRRDERGVLRPYLHRRHRQAFHDGVCVALLLVAVRKGLMPKGQGDGEVRYARLTARIATAISGDSKDFANVLRDFPARTAKPRPITARLRTRRWPWQCSTPSWPAAYNLACAYAALAARAEIGPDRLVAKVIASLEFAICNPECEMERPSEWIGNDPDFGHLNRTRNECFTAFVNDQRKRDYPGDGLLPDSDLTGGRVLASCYPAPRSRPRRAPRSAAGRRLPRRRCRPPPRYARPARAAGRPRRPP